MRKETMWVITYSDNKINSSAMERAYYVEAESIDDAKRIFFKDKPNCFIVRVNKIPLYYPKKEEKTMDENRYNTRVRHAISDELVESRKRKYNLECRCEWIRNYLKESEDTITHKEYSHLIDELKHKEDMIDTLKIAIDVWDQARELCMNIADEMCGEK